MQERKLLTAILFAFLSYIVIAKTIKNYNCSVGELSFWQNNIDEAIRVIFALAAADEITLE